MQSKDIKSQEEHEPVRMLGRQLGRELTDHELDTVAGGIWLGTRTDDGARDAYC